MGRLLLCRTKTCKGFYVKTKGEFIEKTLNGFASKVFQHEYDHLQGIVASCKKNAITASFSNKEEMLAFMEDVKQEDSIRYTIQK